MPDKEQETVIAETYDLYGPSFWAELGEVTREARRHLNTLQRNWSTMDAMTRNSLMSQVHVLVTIDIYQRVKSICEPRGHLQDFEWDVALGVKNSETGPDDPLYHSNILNLYYWLLARYFYWLDRLGVLFRVAPPNLFASDILDEMHREAERGGHEKAVRERIRAAIEPVKDVEDDETGEEQSADDASEDEQASTEDDDGG